MSAISADAPSWYAVRTSSRAEKRIVCRLKEKGIEAYVPLRVEKKKWSDRIKTVETPLITCYVFVRVASGRMIDVLRTQGVVGYVREGSVPVVIPDRQMNDFIRSVDNVPHSVEFTTSELKAGEPIIVTRGPLSGMKGEMIEYANGHKLIIRLNSIGCATVEIDVENIERQQS